MPCCAPTIFPFTNAASSTIAYGPVLATQYGSTPRVFVLYRDAGTGEYIVAPWFTRIEFSNDEIRVDHGGPQNGVVVVN
jgi:hypothetical protein